MEKKTEEQIIAEAMPAAGEFIGFEGMNCDDPCAGWDGKSHRCECGNRRVYWEIEYGAARPVAY